MRKIAISLILIALVSSVAVGATRAYFVDQAVVNDNTVAAGKLDFTLNGDMTETKSIALTNLEPGGPWVGPFEMKVYNNKSTMPIKYRFYDKKESETVPGFYNKLNVKVDHGNCTSGGISPITKTYLGQLKNLTWDSTTDSIGGGQLGVNISHCFELYFQLDASAGNTFQGASAVFDVVVDGTQYINPGWTE